MKSTPRVTDGLAGTGTRVAKGIGTSPVTTPGAGKSGTWAAKTSDNRGLIVITVVLGGVGIPGPGLRPVSAVPVPVVAGPGLTVLGLGGGVTNTSDTLLPSSSAIGLDEGLWKDSKLWSFESGLILILVSCRNRVIKCGWS
jgi:hypothetical protein